MSRFVQLHVLTSYPPSNLNRDDLGRPKTAVVGGATRLRVSSQALKRAWRTSEPFKASLNGHLGVRTKEMGIHAYERLIAGGVAEKDARAWSRAIAGCFGKPKSDKKTDNNEDLHIEQLAHFGPEEQQAIEALTARLIATRTAPTEDDLALLRHPVAAVDIAMFGRMLAANPAFNVEAATQVAHAITVHRAEVEDDYFTAVDDLNNGAEDMGAAHIGETGFGAGVYYLYVCIDRTLLDENLAGDTALRNRALGALIEAIAKVGPTGKQNSFASRAFASLVLAEKGDQQPRSLSLAFLKPVNGAQGDAGMMALAIEALIRKRESLEAMYGSADAYLVGVEGEHRSLAGDKAASLQDVIAFAQAD